VAVRVILENFKVAEWKHRILFASVNTHMIFDDLTSVGNRNTYFLFQLLTNVIQNHCNRVQIRYGCPGAT